MKSVIDNRYMNQFHPVKMIEVKVFDIEKVVFLLAKAGLPLTKEQIDILDKEDQRI